MGLMFWVVVAPLIAAFLILVIPKADKGMYRSIAFLGAVASLVMTVIAWSQLDIHNSGFQHVSNIPWFTLPNVWIGKDVTVGLTFGVDGFSLSLLTLGIVISLFVIASVKVPRERSRHYFFWVSMVSLGIFGVFTALDLFTFLVALEVTLFSTFFLIYLFGGEGRRKAAFKFLIYRGLATVFLLVAFVGVAFGAAGGMAPNAAILPPLSVAEAGSQAAPVYQQMLAQAHASPITFNIQTLTHTMQTMPLSAFPEHWRMGLFIALLFAVFIEEAFVPFHTWLPTTNEVADTGTNMIVGGILTKTGAYVLLRVGVGLFPHEVNLAGTAIAIIGVVNILYGAFAAWAQKDWRRLIAFSSISHMGLVLLGVAALNSAGLQGAMFMLISSGLLTALLFYVTGSMRERTNTILIPSLGGLSKSMPMLSGFLLFAALGSLGLPLTSGFISEFQAFVGGFGTFPAISFVGILGVILSAVYMLYAIQKTTFGPTAAQYLQLADAKAYEYVPIVVLTALVIIIGVYPDVLGSLFNPSVHALLRMGG